MENDGTNPPTPGALSVSAYAKHRRIGSSAVRYAIETGRLDGAIRRGDRGRYWIVDVAKADQLWADGRRAKLPSRERADGSVQAEVEPDPDDGPRVSYQESRAERERAAAVREAANAEVAQIDLALKRGRVVDAVEARARIVDLLSTVRTRVLAVPYKLGQVIPELGPNGVKAAEKLIREALEALADELGE